MEKFKNLGLSEETLAILQKQGIVEPTEIQEKAIPFALEGRDVIAASSTGSGKTLAFAAPIVEKIVSNGDVQSIVLTPTRELAEQIMGAISSFAGERLKVTPVYGGVDIRSQMRRLKNTDVVVGTPGRVLDLLARKALSLRNIKILVLDEFDRMLDMGFSADVDKIIHQTPRDRQTLLFSATTSGSVKRLISSYTENAAEVSAKTFVDHSKLKQVYYDVTAGQKFPLLVHLLKQEEKAEAGLVMVFCSTRKNTDFVTANLKANGIDAKAIHGGLDQSRRMSVLREFNSENGIGVLVCTDVAARGLDIKGVSHVYNYELPQVADDYIHRIGRTARAGENGIAVNLIAPIDYGTLNVIKKRNKMKMEKLAVPIVKRVEVSKYGGRESFGDSRGSGRRESFGDSRGRGSSGSRDSGSRERSNVEMHDAICKKCGKRCRVPFKPTTGVGVSCSDCFVPKGRGARSSGAGRGSFSGGRNAGRSFTPRSDSGRSSYGSRDSGRSSGSSYGSRDSGRSFTPRSDSGRSSYGSRDSSRSSGSSYGSRDSGRSSGNSYADRRGSRGSSSRDKGSYSGSGSSRGARPARKDVGRSYSRSPSSGSRDSGSSYGSRDSGSRGSSRPNFSGPRRGSNNSGRRESPRGNSSDSSSTYKDFSRGRRTGSPSPGSSRGRSAGKSSGGSRGSSKGRSRDKR